VRLNLVAMIGYLQADTPSHWLEEINGWILELAHNPLGDECIWDGTEILKSIPDDESKGIFSYRSVHKRTVDSGKDEVEIQHLWVMMRSGSAVGPR